MNHCAVVVASGFVCGVPREFDPVAEALFVELVEWDGFIHVFEMGG